MVVIEKQTNKQTNKQKGRFELKDSDRNWSEKRRNKGAIV